MAQYPVEILASAMLLFKAAMNAIRKYRSYRLDAMDFLKLVKEKNGLWTWTKSVVVLSMRAFPAEKKTQ